MGAVQPRGPIYTGQTFSNYSPQTYTTDGALRVQASGVSISSTVDIGEFPTATTTGDNESNTSTTRVGSLNYVYDGTDWDRMRGGISSTTTSPIGYPDVISHGVFNSSAPTLATGALAPIQMDTSGNTKTVEQFAPQYEDNTDKVAWIHARPLGTGDSGETITVVNSGASEASKVLKASAGRFYYLRAELATSTTSGTYWLHVGNHASVPSDGAVNLLLAPITVQHTSGTVSSVNIDRSRYGVYATSGVSVWWSTTQFTKTIIVASNGVFEGEIA